MEAHGCHWKLEMAERTGLEPATPGVTGRYSNQLNYRSALEPLRCTSDARRESPSMTNQVGTEVVGAEGIEPTTFAL
jgi:hypothetical protein